jgi:hypothetical protein
VPAVAPLLRRGDAEVLAEEVEEGDAVVYSCLALGAVDAHGYVGEVGSLH